MGFSSIFTGVNFIATVHKLRAPGMGWFQMPLFVWSMYATAIIQVLATPVLAITLLLLVMERLWHIGIFDPRFGGDPVLLQHFFWFYSHPAVYIMIVPGMAIISELIPTFSKKTIFGYRAIAFSSVAIAFIGFLVWGHHMFVSGQTALAGTIFSFLTFLVAIPSGVKVWNWLATMYRGSISLDSPMLYALSFLLLFAIGGLTGLYPGLARHRCPSARYVLHRGPLPLRDDGRHGDRIPRRIALLVAEDVRPDLQRDAGRIGAVLVFVGFNATFFPQFILGSRGMPRRYYNYLPEFQTLHVFSTIGSWILAAGLFLTAGYLFWSLRKKYDAPMNPWGGTTLEWQTYSPPITENFDFEPEIHGAPYDYRPVKKEKHEPAGTPTR